MDRKRKNRKTSIGISICRYNPTTCIPEIYLVKKRITYAYSNFILGRFSISMQDLLNKMSVYEKTLIRYGNFDLMWHHMWLGKLDDKNNKFFNNRKNYFLKLNMDNINRLIDESTSTDPGWEIPKGRLESKETLKQCATREIYEETGADSFQYNIIDNTPKITYSYQIDNTVFIIKYFVARLVGDIKEGIDMSKISQVVENSDAKWVSLKDLQYMRLQHENGNKVIKKCLTIFKKMYKSVSPNSISVYLSLIHI